ncbi:MAG TPA: nitrilase-related carbon-nitrogen hydrolase, partial [Mycobacterium sp.]|nr:nitrilase-related carbon-nitrogen hydrolase [Mycobacterium sp.]
DAFGFAESDTVAPGHEPVMITVGGVNVGITLCYDVRFPELYVELAQRGAQLITVHASWGTGPGKLEQWTLLARARAIDTTGIVAAVDQAYPGDELASAGPVGVGGSLVASAVGEVLASAGADPQLLVSDLDLDAAQKARETIAVLRNRSEFTRVDKAESLR